MIVNSSHKFLFRAFIVLALIIMVVFPASAFSTEKVVHYSELEMTHFYADEFSKVAMYYNYRAMMYYELALYTGDSSFLVECEEALKDLLHNLDALYDTPICARDLQGIVVELRTLISHNLKTLASLAEIFKNDHIVRDTTDIKALIAEADALNERIVTDVNSLITPSQIDLMSLGNLSFAVHSVQQANMVALYSHTVGTIDALNFFEHVVAENEEDRNYFLTNLERTLSKTTDVITRELKSQIGINFSSIYSESEYLITRISNYKFSDSRSVDVETDFIGICFEIDNWFRNQVIGVEFT